MLFFLEGINGGFTSHVFLTLKYDESISTVGLLLLVGLLMRMRVGNNSDLRVQGSVYVVLGTMSMGLGHTRSMGPKRPNSLSRSLSFAS